MPTENPLYPKPSTPPRELEPMKPEPFKRMQPRGPRWSDSDGGTGVSYAPNDAQPSKGAA